MQNYYLIFFNSFYSSLIFSLHSESAWFAALGFGGYNMWLATLIAFVGSVLGTTIDFLAGYCLCAIRNRWLHFGEGEFLKVSKFFRKYFIFLLLFPWLPFTSLFALTAGLFRVPPFMALAIIIIGRICYYSYYLLQQ